MNKLTDRFGREHTYLRISVTDRCNLRCHYCMPPEGNELKKREELLTFEEIYRITNVFVKMGIRKVRITGGEPLVRKDLETLIVALRSIKGIETLAMTTNAVLLKDKAQIIRETGVTALNISLDTFRQDRFLAIARRDDLNNVLAGIHAALKAGFQPLKLNVVVMAGVNDDELMDFVEFIRERPINVRFIEYMPFKDNFWSRSQVFTYKRMREIIEASYELQAIVTEPSAVAKDFAIEGFKGTVSFITSMSESFCGSCNRLRLTADGNIKSCLFSCEELSVRDPLRWGITDSGLKNIITEALSLKPFEHPPMEELAFLHNRSMVDIGG